MKSDDLRSAGAEDLLGKWMHEASGAVGCGAFVDGGWSCVLGEHSAEAVVPEAGPGLFGQHVIVDRLGDCLGEHGEGHPIDRLGGHVVAAPGELVLEADEAVGAEGFDGGDGLGAVGVGAALGT